MKNKKILCWILIILIIFFISFSLILLFSDKGNLKNDNIKDNEIRENNDENYIFQYVIYDVDNPRIDLNIYSKTGIVKIVYPDGQVGEYSNKINLETFYSITGNGEYKFKIVFSDGKEVEEVVLVDSLTRNEDINNSNIVDEVNDNVVNKIKDENSDKKNTTKPINNEKKDDNKKDSNTSSSDKNTVIEDKVIGTIYFNKPISWSNAYLYVTLDGVSTCGNWPGRNGRIIDDNVYAFDIMESMGNVDNIKIQFNNGKYYKTSMMTFPGFSKLYNITLGANGNNGKGEWIDYDVNSIVVGGPVNRNKIKNVIFMIGDGMGINHIKAAEIYDNHNIIFTNFKNTYVSTYSSSDFVTDSAASATALSTGKKTINYYVGIDYYGNRLETLAEYAHKKGLKTGLVVTQTINHATPAGFSAHTNNRSNYDSITIDQVNSGIDLMLGGGTNYFSKDNIINLMNENGYNYITNFSNINSIDNNSKVIGAFAPGSFHEYSNVPSLEEMTQVALQRLDSSNGLFLMVEGSNIDSYSHNNNLQKMIVELLKLEKAVKIAKRYVDNHPDTLLIVTADHETGGLDLSNVSGRSDLLSRALFTSSSSSTNKPHTASFVKVYGYGATADGLVKPSLIDNTYIHNYIKQGLVNNYGY